MSSIHTWIRYQALQAKIFANKLSTGLVVASERPQRQNGYAYNPSATHWAQLTRTIFHFLVYARFLTIMCIKPISSQSGRRRLKIPCLLNGVNRRKLKIRATREFNIPFKHPKPCLYCLNWISDRFIARWAMKPISCTTSQSPLIFI